MMERRLERKRGRGTWWPAVGVELASLAPNQIACIYGHIIEYASIALLNMMGSEVGDVRGARRTRNFTDACSGVGRILRRTKRAWSRSQPFEISLAIDSEGLNADRGYIYENSLLTTSSRLM